MRSGSALASLKLAGSPRTLVWHPGGKALVHSVPHSQVDHIAVTEYQASPARLRVAQDRQFTTHEVSHVLTAPWLGAWAHTLTSCCCLPGTKAADFG